MSRAARLICVFAGVAVAYWLMPASVHIVDWPASGPVRVALLAPLWKLWGALAVATVAAAALTVFGVRHPGSLTPEVSDPFLGTVFAPLGWLWLWALPYLPWLPDRAPVLLALAGPLRWGVLALALCGCAEAWLSGRPAFGVPLPGRRAVFAVSLALYAYFGLSSAAAVGPGADEPHYLVITQSLLRDQDLAIENNHARGDYREYFGGELHPDFLQRGLNEVIYSIHAPGLPALLIPAYAAAGYRGAVVMLCLFGALAALAVFDLSSLLAGPAAAWIAWAAVCLTVPFVPHSWLIFPEIPGALIVAWAALWLHAPLPDRVRTWIWRGGALAILPWLHTKFIVLLAAMTLALLLRAWRNPRVVAALVAPMAVSLALWLFMFYRLYGVWDPQIPYGDFPRLFVLFANIPRGVLGLLFDQKFGLLMYAPVYLVAIAGGWLMLRRPDRRLFGITLLATIGAFVASSTRMYMWWGGSSAPARFLVPIVPLAAPLIAVAFQELRAPGIRAVSSLLLVASLAIAVTGVMSPRRFMLFSAPHGLANMAAAAQGASPLPFLLPTFTEEPLQTPLALLALWLIAALLAGVVLLLMQRTQDRGSGFTAASAALVTFAVGGAVLAGAPAENGERQATAVRGRIDLMRAVDGGSLRGLDYGRRVRLNERQTLDLTAVRLQRSAGELAADPRHLAGPFDLPAGRFTARLTFNHGLPSGASAFVTLGDGLEIRRAAGPLAGEATLAFALPVDAAVWIAVSDEAAARAVQQVDIVAESVVPRHARPAIDVHAIEPIAGGRDAYLVYADDATYPEGGVFWTRGTDEGQVWVSTGGAPSLILTLHVGSQAGRIRVIVDGQDRSVTLARDETRELEIPLGRGDRLVPIAIQASASFRPSDHEPGSTDRRWLGGQVRITLR